MLIQFICIQFRNISLAAIGCLLDGLLSMIDRHSGRLVWGWHGQDFYDRDRSSVSWCDRGLRVTDFSGPSVGVGKPQTGGLRFG